MSLWDALRMNMMISYQELVRTFLKYIVMISIMDNIKRLIFHNCIYKIITYPSFYRRPQVDMIYITGIKKVIRIMPVTCFFTNIVIDVSP